MHCHLDYVVWEDVIIYVSKFVRENNLEIWIVFRTMFSGGKGNVWCVCESTNMSCRVDV